MTELKISKIDIPRTHRPINEAGVSALMSSIDATRQQYPIIVAPSGERYVLIDGHHRVVALERLGRTTVSAIIMIGDDELDRQIATLVTNLHRIELSPAERASAIDEFTEHLKLRAPRAVSKKGGRGQKGTTRLASEELGISVTTARESAKIAAILPEAKLIQGYADLSKKDLLKVARQPTDQQVQTVKDLVAKQDDAKTATPSITTTGESKPDGSCVGSTSPAENELDTDKDNEDMDASDELESEEPHVTLPVKLVTGLCLQFVHLPDWKYLLSCFANYPVLINALKSIAPCDDVYDRAEPSADNEAL